MKSIYYLLSTIKAAKLNVFFGDSTVFLLCQEAN